MFSDQRRKLLFHSPAPLLLLQNLLPLLLESGQLGARWARCS